MQRLMKGVGLGLRAFHTQPEPPSGRYRHESSSDTRSRRPLRLQSAVLVVLLCWLGLVNPSPAASTPCTADLTGSQHVDVLDVLLLLSAWGECPSHDDEDEDIPGNNCAADLNGDGVVNMLDLLILLDHWGPCVGPDNSCAGNCAGQAPSGCWCDASCVGQGDCCSDACEECGHCGQPDSCVGNCGDQAPSGCWCDEMCTEFGDCCENSCTACYNCPTQHCVGHCGGQSNVGCWCDALCLIAGDCCADACASCAICP